MNKKGKRLFTQFNNCLIVPSYSQMTCPLFFFLICRTRVLFGGPLIPLFWTSGDVCPGFQSQGGFLTCMLSSKFDKNSSGKCPKLPIRNSRARCYKKRPRGAHIPSIPIKKQQTTLLETWHCYNITKSWTSPHPLPE